MKQLLLKSAIAFALLFFPLLVSSQILFSEDFSARVQPAGWTNDSAGQPTTNLWVFNNPYHRAITGAGFDTAFAIFDSDEGSTNDDIAENTSLTTRVIDISTASVSLYLEFDQQYKELAGPAGSFRTLQWSNNGATWNTIDTGQYNLGFPDPAVHSIYDITGALAGDSLYIRWNWQGTWDWWWAIDNVIVSSRQLCTGAPNAGTSVSNLPTVCTRDTAYLTLTGNDQLTGLHYQWQSSPDGTTWTDIPGDTISSAYVSQSSNSYYRAQISCGAQTSSSVAVFISKNDPINCYCSGTFANSCDILDKVEINTLVNDSSGCNGNLNNYIDYPATGNYTTMLHADSTYNLIIRSGAGTGLHGAAVWFDFDHNGDFTASNEYFHISDSIPESSSEFTTPIHIPVTAFSTTRMRVRYVYDTFVTQISDCADYSFGETEDYDVFIMNGTLQVNELKEKDFNVYPSPATNMINISTSFNGKINYTMVDITGRTSQSFVSDRSMTELNVASFARGVYFLHIETAQGSVVKKIILN